MGEQADMHGDTTEDSSSAGVGGLAVVSLIPSAATHSDSSAYEDSELDRDASPPVLSIRG